MHVISKRALGVLFFLVLIASGVGKSHAQESPTFADTIAESGALPLAALILYAQDHHPAIQAARERWRAAQQVPAQVSSYDDPLVMWESWNAPESLRIDRADHNIFRLSQKIPFPGKLRVKGEIAAKEAGRREAELRAVALDIAVQVKKAYYDLWQAHQNLRIYTQDKELVAQVAHIAAQKYAVGQGSQPDVLRAQVELTRLSTRVATETVGLSKARARLNLLLSRPLAAPLGTPQNPPPPAMTEAQSQLEVLTNKNRPELVAQARTIERENLALTLARQAYYPDFEVSLSRFVNFGQKDGVGITLSASIPLAFRHKYDAGVQEAAASLSAAQSELRHLQNVARFEVTQALAEAEIARMQLTLFLSTHIPQAEQSLAAARIAYQTGAIDFLSLLDSMRAVEQVHLEHITAAANCEKAWAEVERAVGQELPR